MFATVISLSVNNLFLTGVNIVQMLFIISMTS